MPNSTPPQSTWTCNNTGVRNRPSGVPPVVWERSLSQERATVEPVRLVWLVEAVQDGKERQCCITGATWSLVVCILCLVLLIARRRRPLRHRSRDRKMCLKRMAVNDLSQISLKRFCRSSGFGQVSFVKVDFCLLCVQQTFLSTNFSKKVFFLSKQQTVMIPSKVRC